jgi:hypothetical protein
MDFLHAPLIERSFYPKILGLQDLSIVKTSQNWLKTSEIPKSGWINSISIPENRSNILIFRQHLLGKIQPHPCRPGDVVAVPGTGDGLSARVLQPARMGVVNQLISGLGTILVVGYIYIRKPYYILMLSVVYMVWFHIRENIVSYNGVYYIYIHILIVSNSIVTCL